MISFKPNTKLSKYMQMGVEITPMGRNNSQVIDYPTAFCKIYLCKHYSVKGTNLCREHTSPIRSGKAPYTEGSAPVIRLVPRTVTPLKKAA